MPLPPGVETVTVSAGEPLTLPDGTAMTGRLLFTGPDLVTIAGQDVVEGGTAEAQLVNGEFTKTLLATDATGMSPSGWTYRVDALLDNAPGWVRYISLPKASPAVVLADVLVPDPVAGTFTVLVDPSSVLSGVTLTGTPTSGQVPTATSPTAATWQTPAGGGGDGEFLPLDGGGTVTGNVTVADGSFVVDSSGTAINAVDRGTTSNYAALPFRTAGVDRWAWQMQPGSQDLYLADSANGAPVLRVTPGATPLVTFLGDVAFDGAGGGGGGATIRTAPARITDDDLSGLPAAPSWVIALTSASTPLQCSIAAAAGDRIRLDADFMRSGAHFLDWVLLDNTGAIAVYGATRTSTPPAEGSPSMYPSTSFSYVQGSKQFVVSSGHIAAGLVTIALAHQGVAAGKVYAHPTYPFELMLTNLGPEPA